MQRLLVKAKEMNKRHIGAVKTDKRKILRRGKIVKVLYPLFFCLSTKIQPK